jgi:dTDP-4-dehydrorhamnose reductase
MATLEEAVECGRLEAVPRVGRMALGGSGLFKAPRPRHTAMSNRRLAGLLGRAPRHWREALREHVRRGG